MVKTLFAVLDNDNIMSKALELGIDVLSLKLDTINNMRDLERARANLSCKHDMSDKMQESPMKFLGWEKEFDQSDSEGFIKVRSRSSLKKQKKLDKIKMRKDNNIPVKTNGAVTRSKVIKELEGG